MAKERTFGKSVAIPSHSWKNDGRQKDGTGMIEGTIELVVRFIGREFESDEEKVQTRITLRRDSGEQVFVYLPARWGDLAAPYTGSFVRITSSKPGDTKTRYDFFPETGAKPIAVDGIPTVRHDGKAEPF